MSHDVIASVTALRPMLLELRAATEAERKIPQTIVDALTEQNLFRLSVAADVGGVELAPVQALEVYEALAKAEASVAWVVWNSSLPCLLGRFLTTEQRGEIFGARDGRFAVSTRPTGRALEERGGYRVSGRWSLVSGCMHASWLALMCVVEHDGAPTPRFMYLPASACRIVDTWHVGGLRGTGSHDVVVEDALVPANRSVSPADPSRVERPIGRMPIISTMGAGHAAICLGIAQAATDAVLELATKKVSQDSGTGLRDRATAQAAVAAAAAKLAAFRSHLHALVSRNWETVGRGESPSLAHIAEVWSTALVAGRESRAIVTEMYEVAGTSALYTDSPLERCHRDIHAAAQHVVAQRAYLEDSGRVHFGMSPTSPVYAV